MIAADSALDEAAIEQSQARGELFTSLHQQGRVPGEGAAALWLANAHWPTVAAPTEPGFAPLRLMPAVQQLRARSADAQGRVNTQALAACLSEGALAGVVRSDIAPDQLAAIALAAVEGFMLMAKTHRSSAPLSQGLPVLRLLLQVG